MTCAVRPSGPVAFGHALVADRDIKISVDADLQPRDDVVVEVVGRAGRDAQVREQLLALVGLAVAVAVAEDGQVGHVHHVERPVVPDHAEDRVELVGEDDRLLAVAEQEDAVDRLVRRPDLVHRVLADEQRAVGRRGHLAGILHGRHRGHQPDLEPVGHLGHRGLDRGRGTTTKSDGCQIASRRTTEGDGIGMGSRSFPLGVEPRWDEKRGRRD